MMRRFEDRVALVTGAARGIGLAIARRLAAEGAAVALVDLDADAGERAAHELAESGTPAAAIGCDVTDTRSVQAAVATAAERFGRLDVLVNNAGGGILGGVFAETGDTEWQRQIDLTLNGAVRCIRSALPHLLVSPAGGSVVTIGSVNGLTAFGQEPYSAAKAALQNLTQNLAVRYGRRTLRRHGSGDRSVRFNLVAPGTVRTRVWDDQPGALARLTPMYPLGRVGEPEDIAAAVAFLASDDASWITGIVLPVDGGLLAGPQTPITADMAGDDPEEG